MDETSNSALMFTEEFFEGMIKEDYLNAQNHTMIDWSDTSMLTHEKSWMDDFSNFLW